MCHSLGAGSWETDAGQTGDSVAGKLCKQSYLELNLDLEGWSGAVSLAGEAASGHRDRRLQRGQQPEAVLQGLDLILQAGGSH